MAKILVADDEPEVVQFCTFSLRNHTVISVDNGTGLLQKLKSEKPDLLLLDIMLPGVDGYSLQLQMSEDLVLQDIPVIIITALAPAKGLFDKFKQVANFLVKPFQTEELTQAVEKALEKFPPSKTK